MTQIPSDIELNAYVDGELGPEQAARVAQAVAQDPELARDVAALLRLKSATVNAFLATPPALPGIQTTRRSHVGWWLAAAVVALSVLVGAVASTVLTRQAPTSADPIASVIDTWRRKDVANRVHIGESLIPTLNAAPLKPLLESLEASRLQVLETKVVADGLALDLIGPSGCRLAVWIGPESTQFSKLITSRIQSGTAVTWVAGDRSYLIVSLNAPRDKFTALANALQLGTQVPSLLRENLSAIAEARRAGAPCVG
jgi:hypothetical protein